MPTIAVCTGHAIAGGGILTFACDRRYVINGNYRIQMNEVAIGIPLPTWMLLISQSAIPAGLQAEALLHAKTYTPQQACDAGIFHGLIEDGEDIDVVLNDEVNALMGLDMNAYVDTKKRLREKAAQEALALLKGELRSQ